LQVATGLRPQGSRPAVVPDATRRALIHLLMVHLGSSPMTPLPAPQAEQMERIMGIILPSPNAWFHAMRAMTQLGQGGWRDVAWCSSRGREAWIPGLVADGIDQLVHPHWIHQDERWMLDPAWPIPQRQRRMTLEGPQDYALGGLDLRAPVVAPTLFALRQRVAAWGAWGMDHPWGIRDILHAGSGDLLGMVACLLHRGMFPTHGFRAAAEVLGIRVIPGVGYSEEVVRRCMQGLYGRNAGSLHALAPAWRVAAFELSDPVRPGAGTPTE
jgi:hypothetical protein